MKIVFVGKKTEGYFAEEVAKVRGFDFLYISSSGRIKSQTNDILFNTGGQCDFLIYDIEQYIDEAEEIAEEIEKVSKSLAAKPIILAKAYNPSSNMVRSLIDKDIKNFILSGKASDLKDQLEKNLTGFYDLNKRKEIELVKEIREEEKLIKESSKTIGVAGVCRRIGTTTQSIQIAKYLTIKGYKVALIEMNSTKYTDIDKAKGIKQEISYIEKIASWFDVEKIDESLGMVTCRGLDLFYKQEHISNILKMGYDFYIYDYGAYKEKGFNKTSFIREDLQFVVVGASVTELDYTQEIAQNVAYQKARLIVSFTSKEEEEDILILMEEIKKSTGEGNANRTYFAAYTPDSFNFSDMEKFEKMLPIKALEKEEFKAKKRINFFSKKKRKEG